MANFLFGGSSRDGTPPATGLRIQTSITGKARPIGWGQGRIAGNIIQYSGFTARRLPSGKGGGSSGKGNSGTGSYTYTVTVQVGICEGPIQGGGGTGIGTAIQNGWVNQTYQTLTSFMSGYYGGDYSQTGWGIPDIYPAIITESYVIPSSPSITVKFAGAGFVDNGVTSGSGGVYAAVGSSPAVGQYSVNSTGTYTFNAAQSNQTVNISYQSSSQEPPNMGSAMAYRGIAYVAGDQISLGDSPDLPNWNFDVLFFYNNAIHGLPDADPKDVVTDFLTNAYYGVAGWPSARLGDLTNYSEYCRATGMVVSPVLVDQVSAASFLQDLCDATNSDPVWSGGKFTIVPRGDKTITANGSTYTAPSAPVYLIDDSVWQKNNQATNSNSVAAGSGSDPVTITRLAPRSQLNDIKIEFLDRTNNYNPIIAEAMDDAAIFMYGLRPSDTKTYHFFCFATAAVTSAQLILGRQHIRRTFAFTLPAQYILLEPTDIVELTDTTIGLVNQWVKITEITENTDRTLSVTAEEYPNGAGSVPIYQKQVNIGFVSDRNISPGPLVDLVVFDAPVPLSTSGGMETWIAACGGVNWGGAEIWTSTDNTNYFYQGELLGQSRMGVIGWSGSSPASFSSGLDPDIAHACPVDLTESSSELVSGSIANANNSDTLCYIVDATGGTNPEMIAYTTATLSAGNRYYLTGPSYPSATYIRRGLYETAISAHAAGSKFVRLDSNVFTIPFNQSQLGQTVYLKLVPFNIYGGGKPDISTITAVTHTLTGPPVPPPVTGFEAFQSNGIASFFWDGIPGSAYVFDIGYAPVGTTLWSGFTLH